MKLRIAAILLPLLSWLHGEIVINEIVAASASRNLRWDDNEQPYAGAGPAWWTQGFDDSGWAQGAMPIGFSSGSITTDLGSRLRNISPSFYTRKAFVVSAADATSPEALMLEIQYNDGFIAWVNGVEVARRNMGAEKAYIYHDQLSYRASTQSTNAELIDLGAAAELLHEGENVIAVQVNNNTLNGGMRFEMSLAIDQSPGDDVVFFESDSELLYLPGLREPSSDLVEPALPGSDSSDWIELHNNGASSVDLTGWTMSDDPELLSKWSFPAGTTIPGGGGLLILADDPESPIENATYLHANFKLSSGGEFLGLYDAEGDAVDTLSPQFPKQYPNFSYGLDAGGAGTYFATPSPGSPNSGQMFEGKVDAPDFDKKGGFYDDAIVVSLTTETPGAMIRYTTDGTEPDLENGEDYTSPLSLGRVTTRKGHIIRARAYLNGFLSSNIKTHTFLIGQDARVLDNPSLVFSGDPQRSLYDPFGVMAINGGSYPNSQWRPTGVADYNNVINRGRAYERPIHAEFYFADGSVGFRTDVGLRVAASSYSRPRMQLTQTGASPWVINPNQKPSFNLYFRDDYGNPSVDLPLVGPARNFSSYERFRIRAGKNDIRNPFVIDELFRRLSHDMSGAASLGVLNSLYVNGELKGYYNMVERLREPFFRSVHGSEDNAQWDVLQFEGNDNIAEGDKVAWNQMISLLNAPISNENWERVLEVADAENMANYYMLNIYGATWDWPHNNWVAAKERSPQGRYRLYVWDAEGAMNNAGNRPVSQEMIRAYIATGSGELRDLWRGLNRWEEFRLLFADQVNKHFFNGGILDDRDPENSHVKKRFDELADDFGNLLSLVANQQIQTGDVTRWISPTSGRRRHLFGPTREQFRDNNLWPELTPPEFSEFGGSVAEGYPLLLTNEAGLLHYTTDGSDPRMLGGSPNPSAISQPGSLLEVDLVSRESDWAYNDSEGDLGTAWRLSSYDDESWIEDVGPFGYGVVKDGTETILIATSVNATIPRQPTTYYRKSFEIDQASAYLDLSISLQVDGGTIVYLNGVEAFRESNIPDEVNYETGPTSDSSDGNEGDFVTYTIDPALLMDGENIIAVELHNDPRSSDMIFDAQLSGRRANEANLPVIIDRPVTVKARSFHNGEWSALTEAEFTIDAIPANSGNLAIAEILYNPVGPSVAEIEAGYLDGDRFEFLRLENLSDSNLDLGALRFTDGITFDFSDSSLRVLQPGGIMILVKDLEAFRFRFGSRFDEEIAGEYGGQLSNGGEPLRLIGEGDAVLHEFEYQVSEPWPVLTMLDGHSIQIIDSSGDHGEGGNWMASAMVGGTPDGRLDFLTWRESFFDAGQLADEAISGPDADPDLDGTSNLREFAFGTIPNDAMSKPGAVRAAIRSFGGRDYLTLEFNRTPGSRSVRFSTDFSEDLANWATGGVSLKPAIVNDDGSVTERFRYPVPLGGGRQFMRLKVSN